MAIRDEDGRQRELEGFGADLTPCTVDQIHRPGRQLNGYNFFFAIVPLTCPQHPYQPF